MTTEEFRARLAGRLHHAGLALPPGASAPLEAYYRLLQRWNAKINLTALPLEDPTDETFDRLFIEAISAVKHVPDAPIVWFDLGSGGGSPAIPLKIARPLAKLVMVESKARKTAFLREAVRTLGLANVFVETARFEELAEDVPQTADLVTVRAVRVDQGLYNVASQLLTAKGQLFLFRSETTPLSHPDDFTIVPIEPPSPFLTVLTNVPRGT